MADISRRRRRKPSSTPSNNSAQSPSAAQAPKRHQVQAITDVIQEGSTFDQNGPLAKGWTVTFNERGQLRYKHESGVIDVDRPSPEPPANFNASINSPASIARSHNFHVSSSQRSPSDSVTQFNPAVSYSRDFSQGNYWQDMTGRTSKDSQPVQYKRVFSPGGYEMANAGSGFAQMVSTAKYTDLDSAIPYSQPELQSSLGQQIPPTGHTPTSWQVSYERPGIQDEPSQQTYSTGYSAWPGSGSSSSVYPTGYPSYSQQPDSSTHEQPAYALGFGQQIQVSGYGQDVQSSGYPQDFTQNTSSQGNLQYSYSHVPQNLFNVPHTATMIATPQWSVSGAGRSVNPYGAQFVYWTKERLDAVRNEHRTKSKNWTRLSIVKYDGKEAILNQASKIFDDGNIPDLSPQRFEIRTMEAEKAPRETEIDYEFAKEYMKVITKRTKKTLASMLAEIVPRSASINEVLAFNIDRCSSIESRAVYYTLFKNILQALDQIYRHIEVKAAYQTNSQVLLDKDGTTVSKMTADGERLHGFPHRKNLPIVRSYTVTKYRDPEGFESVHGGTLVFMPHQNGPNLEILGDCLKMKSPEDWPAGIICRPFDKDKYGEMLPGEPDAPKPSRNMMDIVNHEVNGQKAYTCLPWIEDVCKRRDGRTSKYVIGPLFIYMKRVI